MKVQWGVLGAGGIADRRTIPGLLKAKNAELYGVMGPNLERTRKIAEKYGAKAAEDSAEKLLSHDGIQAVYIGSPVDKHLEQIKLCADAGKDILTEKPIGRNVAEAVEAAEYCKNKGVKLGVGFMMRFSSYHRNIKAKIEQGALGALTNANGQFTCWYPDIEGAWRQDRVRSGGGALMDMGIHLIDLIPYIIGSPIVTVAALNDTQTFSYRVDDASALLVRFANGAFGSIHSNFNIPDEAAKWRIEFYGTGGRIVADETIGQIEGGSAEAVFTSDSKEYDAAQDGVRVNSEEIKGESGDLYTKEIESFSRSVIENTPPEVPAEAGIQAQKVAEAAYLSSSEMRFVNIAEIG